MNDVNNLFNLAMSQLTMLGRVLLEDDMHDFGWFTYHDRPGHKDHPSPFHHWQIGAFFIFIGEAIKMLIQFLNAIGINIADVFSKINDFFMIPTNQQQFLGDYYVQ
jgi:hypothetical protein